MKFPPFDDEESQRRWNRNQNQAEILGIIPKSFSGDLLKLTVCFRYSEMLLRNVRVRRYLAKNHPQEMHRLDALVEDCQKVGSVRS